MANQSKATLVLRLGLAFVFAYAGIAIFISASDWLGFMPSWVEQVMSREVALKLHGAFDIFLAAWLVLGKKVFYAALLGAATLISIVIFNLGAMDIVFRDLGLLAMAVALAALTNHENSRS